jgi:predicted nuclease of predicted toxin-antitoxin system
VRVLCDRHVDDQYVTALQYAEGITARTVGDELSEDADDTEIIAHAETHEWVVLTADQRFLYDDESDEIPPPRIEAECGVIYYVQLSKPSATDIVSAIRAIAAVYPDYSTIETYATEWTER